MRKALFAAAAVAAVLSLGASADKASAMTGATPTQLGLATAADSSLVQKTRLVCGRWGCRRIWGPRVGWVARRPIYGFAGPRPWGWGPGVGFSVGFGRPGWGWGRPGWGWGRPGWGWGW